MSVVILLAVAAQASSGRPAPVAPPAPPPPPVISVPAPHARPLPELLTSWRAGEVRCQGVLVKPVRMTQPYTTLRYGPGRTTATLSFRIDVSGRPLGITPAELYGDTSDLAPALASSVFPAGAEQANCSVLYVGSASPVGEAPVADAMAFTIFPVTRPTRALWDRVKPAGATCSDPPPALRNRAFPDFERIPQPNGTTSWSMIGYDISARGRPVNLRVVAGSGNAALDRDSLKAVRASRFAPERRTGCLYPYHRRGAALTAPAMPEEADHRPAGANCPAQTGWARPPVLDFPEPFRRRGIEGWAVVSYDVAPWGETGDIKVLAAEPASAFGEYGVRTIRSGRKAPSTGFVGCVDRVRFVMSHNPPLNAVAEPTPPY